MRTHNALATTVLMDEFIPSKACAICVRRSLFFAKTFKVKPTQFNISTHLFVQKFKAIYLCKRIPVTDFYSYP